MDGSCLWSACDVVSVNGEYNVGIGVVHRAKTAGRPAGGAIEHSQITEIYHIMEGSATLVTSGAIDPRESPPDSMVVKVLNGPSTGGGTIQKGVSRKVGPGDVVIIPPNTPHWFSEIVSDRLSTPLLGPISRGQDVTRAAGPRWDSPA